jgi:uncharacterized integral membrane protein
MSYQYKRRRPSIIRNFWVYRRLIGSAVLLGLMLWFIWANGDAVTVAFPFRLGHLNSTLGVVILLSAIFGSLLTLLVMTVVSAMRRLRGTQQAQAPSPPPQAEAIEDRPPPDYAAKTTEGFSDAHWAR